jgi:multidrug efflux pump
MHLLGFSVNMLTMFGMILAIGLVVDDAIVVVENVETNMNKHGLGAMEASLKAMTEIAGALISIVLVLVAVFLPVAFLGGVTGTLYQQFAITIAISVVISGIMALTLSPALAAIIIKAHQGEKKGFFRWFENSFERLTNGYVGVVARLIQGWPITLLAFGAVLAGILLMFRVLPGSFVPDEDQGYFFVVVEAPDTASQGVVGELMRKIEKIVAADPAVQDVASVNGFSLLDGSLRNNAGVLFVSMKPFEERKEASQLSFAALPRINRQLAGLTEGFALAVNPPPIPGLGTTGGFEMYLQNRGAGNQQATSQAVQAFVKAARTRPELAGVSTTYRGATQQLFVDLDRSKAEVLGVSVQDAFQTMQAFFGSQIAGQFSQFSRVWWVVLQADAAYRTDPGDFEKVYVRSRTGTMVPLSALISVRYVAAPKLLERFNGFPAVKVTGNPAEGFSSGQALSAMEAVAAETLPADFSFAWSGQALQEKGAGGTSAIAFIAGLIVVFLLLAAQFEKWTLPLAVLLTVPVAILGALLLTWAVGLENDVYFQVGLVTLVGLSAKNAILICEVAIEHVHAGMPVLQAALQASRARLRAIVMTSLAFGLGCVPLALATGPGANSLRAIGTGVIGGILASTLVAIFFAPFFFWLLESASQRFGGKKAAEQMASADVA